MSGQLDPFPNIAFTPNGDGQADRLRSKPSETRQEIISVPRALGLLFSSPVNGQFRVDIDRFILYPIDGNAFEL